MPRTGIAVALIVMLLTGIVIGQLRSLVTSSRQTVQAPEPGSTTAAEDFYSAVNHYLRTGDSASVLTMLSPGFVRHNMAMSGDADASDVLDYLALFRQTFPDARWEARVLAAHGPLVAFEVRLQTASSAAMNGPLAPVAGSDYGYEVLRIEAGLIAEWWANKSAPPPLEYSYLVNRNSSALTRLEARVEVVSFDSHAIYEINVQNAVIVVASEGDVRVRLSMPEPGLPSDVDTVALAPGGAVFVPPGTTVRFANSGRDSASLLMISLSEKQLVAGLASDYDVIESTGVRRWLQAGGGELPHSTNQLKVQIERMLLFPCESVPAHTTGPAELLAIDSGEVEVTLAAGTAVWTQPGKSFLMVERTHVITTGTGLSVDPGSRVEYRASGETSAVFWLITLIPNQPT